MLNRLRRALGGASSAEIVPAPQRPLGFILFFRDDERDPVSADAHFREYLHLDPEGVYAAEARASLLQGDRDCDAVLAAPAVRPTWRKVP